MEDPSSPTGEKIIPVLEQLRLKEEEIARLQEQMRQQQLTKEREMAELRRQLQSATLVRYVIWATYYYYNYNNITYNYVARYPGGCDVLPWYHVCAVPKLYILLGTYILYHGRPIPALLVLVTAL